MSKLRYQFGLIVGMLVLGACSSDEQQVQEGVAADGSSASRGSELSAGLGSSSVDTGSSTLPGSTAVPSTGNTTAAPSQAAGTTATTTTAPRATATTPAATSTTPATAATSSERYHVVAQYLNVRKGPGKSFPVVRVLKKGDAVTAQRGTGSWLKISENEFVSSRFVKTP